MRESKKRAATETSSRRHALAIIGWRVFAPFIRVVDLFLPFVSIRLFGLIPAAGCGSRMGATVPKQYAR
ncbi:MAG: hypothetical protein N2688_14295, partial [Burkholderiaceae bacterium]|nr:hypothetical protein [Burkholderiaceae bacterium]